MRHTEFHALLTRVLECKGEEVPLPNVRRAANPQEALDWIASASSTLPMHSVYALQLPGGMVYYPKVMLNTGGMGNQFNGSGVVVARSKNTATAFAFSICEHEWDESGANHTRGWHPARCKKCGFDASIDSGD